MAVTIEADFLLPELIQWLDKKSIEYSLAISYDRNRCCVLYVFSAEKLTQYLLSKQKYLKRKKESKAAFAFSFSMPYKDTLSIGIDGIARQISKNVRPEDWILFPQEDHKKIVFKFKSETDCSLVKLLLA